MLREPTKFTTANNVTKKAVDARNPSISAASIV